jgi:hypothetical protein
LDETNAYGIEVVAVDFVMGIAGARTHAFMAVLRLAPGLIGLLFLGTWGCGESGTENHSKPEAGGAAGRAGAPSPPGGQATSAGSNGAGRSGGGEGGGGQSGGGESGFPGVDLPADKGWLELPETPLRAVCACENGFPQVCANNYCDGIFSWSSGAYDSLRHRLIVFGGGHSDYFGNELYALSLSDRTMKRLTDPGLPLAGECLPTTAGGTQPSSRHTYDTLLYLEHADRLFVFGGSMPPCGYLSDDTWTYSFADQKWEAHAPSGPTPKAVPGIAADYDPVSKKVFLHDDHRLYSYSLEQDAFELLLDDDTIDYHMTGSIDAATGTLVLVGTGNVYSYDIRAAKPKRSVLITTGADTLVQSVYPGLAYDSDSGHIVAWNGGDSAYSLDIASRTWTALSSPNGPGDANETGTFKRWRYVPGENSFVLVNGAKQNAFVFRL